MGYGARGSVGRHRTLTAFTFLIALKLCAGVEHNLPDNVELVDPKDLGLDSQFDLDKLLGNVKALPIDTNALSSALGKPGLKTQVLTVGFDGSEGLNLDDFELPQMKNDEHAPLAQEAFKSFKSYLRNSSMATPFGEETQAQHTAPAAVQFSKPVQAQTLRPGTKRRTMMKRRKVVRVNGTTTTPPPPQEVPAASSAGPKVIELDSSQIEKLIASGKIGPPKSLTPGGPQVIELGQRDLDALLSSENGDEIKQILEGGDTIQNFDLSQLAGGAFAQSPPAQSTSPQVYPQGPRVSESIPPVSHAQIVASPIPTNSPSAQTTTLQEPSTEDTSATASPQPSTTALPPNSENTPAPTTTTTTGLPIIYQYNSAQDAKNSIPPQGIQGAIPLQFYSSHANGQQQARLVKTPTFEFISAPPVSFSSSVLSSPSDNSHHQNQPPPQSQPQQQFQVQPQPIFIQPQLQPQFQHQFITLPQQNFQQPQQQQQFLPNPSQQAQAAQPTSSPESPKPVKKESSLNKIIPAAQTSHHTEEVKFKNPNSLPSSNPANSNYISALHKVNLPLNSVKLVTPSPQIVQSVLNQVPDSFQPALIPNHVVSSPVLDPLRVGNGNSLPSQNAFLRPSQPQLQEVPFRNTHLFSNSLQARNPPVRTHPSAFVRFPAASNNNPANVLSSGGPNRFRVAESQNPFFAFRPAGAGFGNLVLNSFVAGDGLNYRPRSREDFNGPGI